MHLFRNEKNTNYRSKPFSTTLTYAFLVITLSKSLTAWAPDLRPKLTPKQDIIFRYFGNHTDFFKILDYDQTTLLLGARNAVFNITFDGLRENYKLEWESSAADRELCALKGKRDEDCQNYIRVFARKNDGQIMICGTNSYKPRCRHYTVTNDQTFDLIKDVEAQGVCPYSPTHNSTYVYTGSQLYSATVADFSGNDPLIYRESLRTEQYDLKQLNQPDFVKAVERNGYVFFFFREISMEYMNCGKAIYSRVGRVCKNDRGGPYTLSKSWTSFLKTRLNCSVPGEYPFYFNEIQATSGIIEASEGTNGIALIYAVFTTPTNAIPGSAICAFSLDDILAAFEGRFKSQKDSTSNWLPIQLENVPEPRPGLCVDDSRTLSSTSVNFVKNHPLMETAVPTLYGRPLLTKVTMDHRLTSIVIDENVSALDKTVYNVIYAGTDNGSIIKFINISPTLDNHGRLQTVIIYETQALPLGTPVRELVIARKTQMLIVVSDGDVTSIRLHHCTSVQRCEDCINLQDPNCVWDVHNHECKAFTNSRKSTPIMMDGFIQSLNTTAKNTARICQKYGDIGNRVDQRQSPLVSQSTRGTVSGVGQIMPSFGRDFDSNEFGKEISGMKRDDGLTISTLNNENKITLTSVDSKDLLNSLPDGKLSEEKRLQLAGKSLYWVLILIVLTSVFVFGIVVGFASRRICKTSAFHTEHRNQLNPKPRQFLKRNSGKDVNLLVNSNAFSTVLCNNKKDNIGQDFVGDKDRSHECKNSTENLEKEIPCKTSTLTKVKRTYI
ncbi:semaphorin-1A isoform X2 [Eupeodes corollae]|uniref:semaphorin-1A isoform X2 n=1 Tax=Eupeodes corollae TaxID=290404 RepID=UPI0024924B2A|nr:semaphorin-1A isoform X2 [Eupeodes corollae]